MTSQDPAPRPTRRRFTGDYKAAIVAEHDGCTTAGEKGALLRREGLYSSHISEWRKASSTGALAGLAGTPRSSKRTRPVAFSNARRPKPVHFDGS